MEPRIDDDEARRLLRAAGETVEVSQTPPLPDPAPRRVWPTVVAVAAAVAAIVGIGVVWQPTPSGEDAPLPTPGVADASTPPAGSVPVVTGLRQADATEELESAGFTVTDSTDYSCGIPEGRVIDTEPGVGVVPADGGVTIVVSRGVWPAASCAMGTGEEEWGLVDLGSGRAADVNFADEVSVIVDGGTPRTLTRAEALDPATWSRGSALALFAAAAQAPYSDPEGWQVPEPSVRVGLPPIAECGVDDPGMSGELDGLTIAFGEPGAACPTMLTVLRMPGSGKIVALFARTARPDAKATDITVPDVRGLSRHDAQEMLVEAGFAVSSHTERRCTPAAGVTSQRPRAGQEVAAGSVVSLTFETQPGRVDCAALERATDDLLAWARGGTPPDLGARVTLMLGYEQVTVLTGADRLDRERWLVCDPAGSDVCGNALTTLATYDGEVERDDYADDVPILPDGTPQPDCTADLGGFPRGFYGWHATLRPPVSVDCGKQWRVEVFVDDAGLLKGVNLAPSVTR